MFSDSARDLAERYLTDGAAPSFHAAATSSPSSTPDVMAADVRAFIAGVITNG